MLPQNFEPAARPGKMPDRFFHLAIQDNPP